MPDESEPFYRGAKGNESLKRRSFFTSRPASPLDRSTLPLLGCDNRRRQDCIPVLLRYQCVLILPNVVTTRYTSFTLFKRQFFILIKMYVLVLLVKLHVRHSAWVRMIRYLRHICFRLVYIHPAKRARRCAWHAAGTAAFRDARIPVRVRTGGTSAHGAYSYIRTRAYTSGMRE